VRGNEVLARQRLDDEIEAASATSPVEDIHTLNEYLAIQRYPFQAFSWVSTAIGAIALLLTIAGIYGVLSYLVEQRTREIGVRMALGAGVSGVVSLVLRQTAVFASSGAVIGATLALGVSRLFEQTLWIVDMYDVLGYAGGVVVVFAAALAASLAPARRAARVDPMEALRAE